MTDDELRKLAEAALSKTGPWCGHCGEAFSTREPELARAVLRLLEERARPAEVWVVIADRIPDETLVDSVWSTEYASKARATEVRGGYDDHGGHWSARPARFTVDADGRLVVTPYEEPDLARKPSGDL